MQVQIIEQKIHDIRNQKVLLDFDIALLYEVETRALKQSVKRNHTRFPEDFMFQLTKVEWLELITNCDKLLPDGVKFSPSPPFAFTEQGVAMLSGILRSQKAVDMNIAIMRAFVFIRQYALSHKDLTEKLNQMEHKYNKQFRDIHEAIDYLLQKDKSKTDQATRKQIGFKGNKNA